MVIIIKLVVVYQLASYCYWLSPTCTGTGIEGILSMVLLNTNKTVHQYLLLYFVKFCQL